MANPKVCVRELTQDEKNKLITIKQKRNIEFSLRQRADIILLSDQGCEVKFIALSVGLDKSHVYKWINRFNEGGIDALGDIPKPGRPKGISSDAELKIVAIALTEPRDLNKPFNSWTVDTIRQEAIRSGIVDTISWESTRRILKKHNLSNQRTATWKVSKDPDYEVKKKML